MKQKMIAAKIAIDCSTISRELARNIAKLVRTAGDYVASNAMLFNASVLLPSYDFRPTNFTMALNNVIVVLSMMKTSLSHSFCVWLSD
jgi:hypothetical protein